MVALEEATKLVAAVQDVLPLTIAERLIAQARKKHGQEQMLKSLLEDLEPMRAEPFDAPRPPARAPRTEHPCESAFAGQWLQQHQQRVTLRGGNRSVSIR